MSFATDKLLISFGFILLFTLFVVTHSGLAVDVAYPDRLLQINEDHNAGDYIHYMAKRRFLPTRRDSQHYVSDDVSSDNDEDDSHLNSKRYFLKSKRYFLNSKRNDE